MVKKCIAVCLAPFILTECGENHAQEQFNRSSTCSYVFLEKLKKDCPESVQKWIDANQGLLLRLSIYQVSEIITCNKDCYNTKFLEEKYKAVTGNNKENFEGGGPFLLKLNEIKSKFLRNLEVNNSILREKWIEYQRLVAKIGKNVSIDFLKMFKDTVLTLYQNLYGRISEIHFKYDPNKDELIKTIENVLGEFERFCDLVNVDDGKELVYGDLLEKFDNQKKSLEEKIQTIQGDTVGSFVEMILPKIAGWNEDLKIFLSKMNPELAEEKFKRFQNYSILSPDDVKALIGEVNISHLIPNITWVDLKEIQKFFKFRIYWIDGRGVILKTDFNEVCFPGDICGVRESKIFNGCVLIMDVDQNVKVLSDFGRFWESIKSLNTTLSDAISFKSLISMIENEKLRSFIEDCMTRTQVEYIAKN